MGNLGTLRKGKHMRLSKTVISFILCLFLSGCATLIKYPLDKETSVVDVPLSYKVAVDIFEDVRPAEERDGTLQKNTKNKILFTQDKNFKPDIEKQISQMLVDHLDKTKLFTSAKLMDISNDIAQSDQEMETLVQQDIDIAILGKINHFYGYMANPNSTAMLFGLVGVLAEMVANPKKVGAKVEYKDIKILDLKNKKILWEGKIEYDFEEEDTFYDAPATYALEGLKKANTKFIYKLKSVL